MPALERDGARIVYEVTQPAAAGAPAVVFLHNIFCDRRVFEAAVAALRDRYRTIAIDFRGHGDSQAGPAAYTIEDLAGDVRAVMDREGVARATIVGLSIGATVAMELALAHPARVEGLVLMGADADADTLVTAARNRLFNAAVTVLGMRAFVLSEVGKTLFGRWFRTEAPDRFAVFRERLARFPPRAARRSMRAWSSRRPLLARLPALAMPTRVVVGDEDLSCPLPCGEKIAAAIPGADLVRIPQAGHTMPAERPAETTQAIATFLEKITISHPRPATSPRMN
jgi:pimeloyl-ACP methyl ester carboxylesterase